jgi:hypothetical protein
MSMDEPRWTTLTEVVPFLLLNPFLSNRAKSGLISTPTTSPSGPTARLGPN